MPTDVYNLFKTLKTTLYIYTKLIENKDINSTILNFNFFSQQDLTDSLGKLLNYVYSHINTKYNTCNTYHKQSDTSIETNSYENINSDINNNINTNQEENEYVNVNSTSIDIDIKNIDNYTINFFKRGIYNDIDTIEMEQIETFDKLNCIKDYFSDCIKSTEKKTKNNDYCKLHETEKSGYFIKTTDIRSKKLIDMLKKQKQQSIILKYTSSYNGKEKDFNLNIKNIIIEKRGKEIIITSNEISQYSNLIEQYKQEIKEKIKYYFKKFCNELLEFQDNFMTISNFLTDMDVYLCKAKLAIKYKYCKPIINDDETLVSSYLEAKSIRHVLIEHLNNEEIYVPNDVSLSNETNNGILLFGTNAVGKSSLIKSIGICVVMAQSGFFVPCDKFIFKPFKSLFTRILGNDNIFKGLSTFAVEMSELRTILKLSDENSLILGDELCSGTELGSAISIFVTGLEKLSKRNTKYIFATHFHEVTTMPEILDLQGLAMKHMSVYYDGKEDALIYDRKLKDGPGNNMYGLEVCKALNLPPDFIEDAYSIREKYYSSYLQTTNEEGRNLIIGNGKRISLQSKSHFNNSKIKNECEICGKDADEVHHLQHQQFADNNNFIQNFHKNHLANLISVCSECHDRFHNSGKQHKRVKSTKGIKIVECNENY
jgi:DNA mismatch repair protein MutS